VPYLFRLTVPQHVVDFHVIELGEENKLSMHNLWPRPIFFDICGTVAWITVNCCAMHLPVLP